VPRRSTKTNPQILEMPKQKVAVVKTVGRPDEGAQKAFPALYGAVYPLKFARKKQGKDFKFEPPRAR
jgi:hypothetical protein